jgi:hypothetical protein
MAKDIIIKSRLDEQEYQELTKLLSTKRFSKLDISKLIRLALAKFKDNNKFEAIESFNALYKVLLHNTVDMSRVTGNLNQIAYHLNKKDDVDSKEIVKVINELAELHKKNFENFKALKNEVEKMI